MGAGPGAAGGPSWEQAGTGLRGAGARCWAPGRHPCCPRLWACERFLLAPSWARLALLPWPVGQGCTSCQEPASALHGASCQQPPGGCRLQRAARRSLTQHPVQGRCSPWPCRSPGRSAQREPRLPSPSGARLFCHNAAEGPGPGLWWPVRGIGAEPHAAGTRDHAPRGWGEGGSHCSHLPEKPRLPGGACAQRAGVGDVCASPCTCPHVCVSLCTCPQVHVPVHISPCVHVPVCPSPCTRPHVCMCPHVHVPMHMTPCVRVPVCLSPCAHVPVCVWPYVHIPMHMSPCVCPPVHILMYRLLSAATAALHGGVWCSHFLHVGFFRGGGGVGYSQGFEPCGVVAAWAQGPGPNSVSFLPDLLSLPGLSWDWSSISPSGPGAGTDPQFPPSPAAHPSAPRPHAARQLGAALPPRSWVPGGPECLARCGQGEERGTVARGMPCPGGSVTRGAGSSCQHFATDFFLHCYFLGGKTCDLGCWVIKTFCRAVPGPSSPLPGGQIDKQGRGHSPCLPSPHTTSHEPHGVPGPGLEPAGLLWGAGAAGSRRVLLLAVRRPHKSVVSRLGLLKPMTAGLGSPGGCAIPVEGCAWWPHRAAARGSSSLSVCADAPTLPCGGREPGGPQGADTALQPSPGAGPSAPHPAAPPGSHSPRARRRPPPPRPPCFHPASSHCKRRCW